MQNYLLSILIFLPVFAAFVTLILPKNKSIWYRYLALGVSTIQLLVIVMIFILFKPSAGVNNTDTFQFVEKVQWISLDLSSFGKISAEYFVGVDGLSIGMVILSVIVFFIAVISSWKVNDRAKGYFSLLLILNASVIGCFLALDFLLFYLFFEFMLLPMYFLIGLWGGPRREYASIKFFLYTLLGSVLILIVMIALNLSTINPAQTAVEIGLVTHTEQVTPEVVDQVQQLLQQKAIDSENMVHTFNLVYMTDAKNLIPESIMDLGLTKLIFSYPARMLAFLLLFVGFAIKIPIVPLHTWLPDAHVEAPTAISVILAGVLLKVGAYGLIRTGILIFPDGALNYAWLMGMLGTVSIIYGALNAIASKDLKRLIAYSSVSHMGFVMLGIAALNTEGVGGGIYQMVSHGIISSALFLIAGVIYDRTHNRMIENYSGLASVMPKYSVVVVIFFFASLGLPGFSGFIAEIFVLIGALSSMVLPKWMMIVATFGLVLSAVYFLWTIQRMFFGKSHFKAGIEKSALVDITSREWLMFVPLMVLTVLLGIFPNILLKLINESVITFVDFVNTAGLENLKQIIK
ncbi:MAG TPA: NADH-quinone oxidoreductase subunit M [Fulvivirga sp.]|nr:NADH-quinone oxidoreductase subunit M [Fulvivirga sp.]